MSVFEKKSIGQLFRFLIVGVSGARISIGTATFEGMALAAIFAVILGGVFKLFKKI